MEPITTDQFFEKIEELTKDFDFKPIKELTAQLPEADRKIFENMTNIKSAFSQNYNAQKIVGKQPKYEPAPDPKTEEGMQKLRELIGAAKTKEDINLGTELNDLAPDIQDKIKDSFVKSGLTPKQAKDVFDTFLNITKEDVNSSKAAAAAKAKEIAEQKILKFGDKLEGLTNLAEDYINKQPEALKAQLKAIAETPDGLDYIASLSKISSGDSPSGPQDKATPVVKSAAEQIKDIMAGSDKKFMAELYGLPYPGKEGRPTKEATARAKERWTLLHEKAAKGL